MVSLDRSRIWMSGKYSTKFLSVHYGPNSQMTPTVPLTESATIINGNSLHTDWQVTDYILGNPPFVGHSYRTKVQQADVTAIMPSEGKFGKLDYVACWHIKASRMMTANPMTKTAFPHCQNSCHPHLNNPNGGKGDNHGTIQCRTQTSHTKQTFIT